MNLSQIIDAILVLFIFSLWHGPSARFWLGTCFWFVYNLCIRQVFFPSWWRWKTWKHEQNMREKFDINHAWHASEKISAPVLCVLLVASRKSQVWMLVHQEANVSSWLTRSSKNQRVKFRSQSWMSKEHWIKKICWCVVAVYNEIAGG